jgi:YbbR domain-containing protein
MNNKWMLRAGSFLFAFALLTGCGTNDNNEEPNEAPMNEENGDMMEEEMNGENNGTN